MKEVVSRKTKEGTYYLGRVIKLGVLDDNILCQSLKKPHSISVGGYEWTFTGVKEYKTPYKFIFGKLTKYEKEGVVEVIDTNKHEETTKLEENMIAASSPFVYLPEYSGIAYLHIWNKIEQETFVRRFSQIIEETNQKFMITCNVDPVSDLYAFVNRLGMLNSIELIKAKIHPPNPLFGPLWKDLKEYLKRRNVGEMKIEEKSVSGESLFQKLKELIEKVEDENAATAKRIDIGDQAILMAIDGYGKGKVHGIEGKRKVVLATSDTIQKIQFLTEPDPVELVKIVYDIFKNIKNKRHMEHEK